MSIVTSGGAAGGSLSSGNISNSGREDHHHHHHHHRHHRHQEVVTEKQEEPIIDDIHNQNFHGSSINSLSSTTTLSNSSTTELAPPAKKKRNTPGNPDPSAEVIALSPNTLCAKNRFVCEICGKGFQRDQNLQLHRRGHNLPWKLRQRSLNEAVRKRVYVCPEASCVHHSPARALGDLTGIKKHFSRKHGEKKWKCERCSKKYAVQSDWKAHSKTCGTREYKCECGTIFSRRDSFITHRAFCDAIAEENSKTTLLGQISSVERHPPISSRSEFIFPLMNNNIQPPPPTNDNVFMKDSECYTTSSTTDHHQELITTSIPNHVMINNLKTTPLTLDHHHHHHYRNPHDQASTITRDQYQNGISSTTSHYMSATALLQKAAQMGSTVSGCGANGSVVAPPSNCFAHHDLLGGLLFGQHPNHASKNDIVLHGGNSAAKNSTSEPTGGDVMTLDFLGIGRSQKRLVNNLHYQNDNHEQSQDHHHHHRQVLGYNGVINGGDQSDNLQGLSLFEKHAGIMGKHLWEV